MSKCARNAESAGAAFSTSELYRYALWRVWNPAAPFWTIGMLNPSTADHQKVDPTVQRVCGMAQRGGAGGIIVWNLFAWRSTDPKALKQGPVTIGPSNDRIIKALVKLAPVNIAAWGAHGSLHGRAAAVLTMLSGQRTDLHALAFTADGTPRHPLYLGNDCQPLPWDYRKELTDVTA